MGGCASKKFEEDQSEYNLPIKPLLIEAETWKRDSHGLFDYETKDVTKTSLKVVGSTRIFRDSEFIAQTIAENYNSRRADVVLDISFESRGNNMMDNNIDEEEKASEVSPEIVDPTKQSLARVIYKFGNYWIFNKLNYNKNEDLISKPEDLIWFAVRDYNGSASSLGYKVEEHDILKFGRARLKVIKINISNLTENSSNIRINGEADDHNLNPLDISRNNIKEITEEEPTCRICFVEGYIENPLISV